MLVYINDLLSSGEIPDLFAQEDKDEIINAVRSETKALGLVDTAENCWSTFIQKAGLCPHCPATSDSSITQAASDLLHGCILVMHSFGKAEHAQCTASTPCSKGV